MRRLIAMVVPVMLALAALRWWAGGPHGDQAATELLKTEQYCPLSTRLEEALAAAGVDGPPGAWAVEEFFGRLGADLQMVEREAPPQIRDSVGTVVDGLRAARRGGGDGAGSAGFGPARARLADFQRDHCVGGEPGAE